MWVSFEPGGLMHSLSVADTRNFACLSFLLDCRERATHSTNTHSTTHPRNHTDSWHLFSSSLGLPRGAASRFLRPLYSARQASITGMGEEANLRPAAAVLPAPLPCDKDLDNGSDDHSIPAPSLPCVWERGLVVLTPYGWGTVRRYRGGVAEDGMLEVRLEWSAICYVRPTDILDRCVRFYMPKFLHFRNLEGT